MTVIKNAAYPKSAAELKAAGTLPDQVELVPEKDWSEDVDTKPLYPGESRL
jgi:hypothetical protein